VRPLSAIVRIGKQMEANLNELGIQTVGGLANANLNDLQEQFGVMGNQIYHHAWGIDLSKLGVPLITNGALSFG
ncbi:DNA polymerase thumb domain-containing protein, partial [Lysinibacillus sp. D4B1_S16]|uniref:DNA polymerase thumb domain-containing protein n=1 Tax=Lysinibacillus sp. D4B1_S16 TaxID=2941231 RepID=UPI0037CBC5F1